MKNVKASEARKRWFQLLDDALRGEVIAIERNGQRIVLRREEPAQTKSAKASEQYKKIIKVPRADEADQWSWEWRGLGAAWFRGGGQEGDAPSRHPFSNLAGPRIKTLG